MGENNLGESGMQYIAAKDAGDVVSLLAAKGNKRILAGGTDVLVQMKLREGDLDYLIDIKRISGISEISNTPDGFEIGACVSGAKMGKNAALKAMWPGVVEAVELIGSTQVQGRATMVGNLCNGSPAADSVPALLTAGASAKVFGPDGEKEVNIAQFLDGPGRIKLDPQSFITSIRLPTPPERSADAYLRFIPRTEMDIAVAGASVNLSLGEDGTVLTASVALGAVAPTAVLVPEAALALIGSKLENAALTACAIACAAACAPIDDKRGTVEFRTRVAGVLAIRAAKIAYTRAGGQL